MADYPVFVDSENTSSERRVSPQWTIALFKTKMWPITGIPPGSQILSIPYTSEEDLIESFNIEPLSVIKISDKRPAGQRPNYTDDTNVNKFELTEEEYDGRSDSVRAFKKRNHLGRFDPDAGTKEEMALAELNRSGVVVGARCRVEGEADRRGIVRYVGQIPEIASGGLWIGVEYDEPVGKNDGSVKGVRYFEARDNFGGFLRPSKIQIGHFLPKDFDEELLGSDDEI